MAWEVSGPPPAAPLRVTVSVSLVREVSVLHPLVLFADWLPLLVVNSTLHRTSTTMNTQETISHVINMINSTLGAGTVWKQDDEGFTGETDSNVTLYSEYFVNGRGEDSMRVVIEFYTDLNMTSDDSDWTCSLKDWNDAQWLREFQDKLDQAAKAVRCF